MAKLIFSLDGAFLGEYPLDKERISIGRRPANDIHIDNLAVSGEHASVLTIGNDSFLEDLDSSNGTMVNGKPIKKHILQHTDVIEIGKYQLKYLNEAAANAPAPAPEDFEKTMIIRPSAMKSVQPPSVPASVQKIQTSDDIPSPLVQKPEVTAVEAPRAASATSSEIPVGRLQVLNGTSIGKELVLNKALTTLGKPGVQVAVITKRPQGYFITHVEGQNHPKVNEVSVGAQAHALNEHDVIEIAGVKMEFFLARG
jgi:predicted component of type VI protein secretion system